MENLREMEEWKCHKVLLLLVLLSSHNCFFVQFRAVWVVIEPYQYNAPSVVTPDFPYRSSSETYCLKLLVITALYRLKEANLLGEKLTVSLGIVPDASVSKTGKDL